MTWLKWDEKYSVGIELFDHQHQAIFSMLNDFHQAMLKGQGKDELENIIRRAETYAAIHFKAEEEAFEKYAYPNQVAHVRQHDDFRKKLAEFKARRAGGDISVTLETMRFLKEWLSQHILGTDVQYSEFLVKKGMK